MLFNWEIFGNRVSTIGKTAHAEYVHWMVSSSKGNSNGKQQTNFSEIQSLKETVTQEQIAYKKILESLTHEKRRGLYVQFCPAVPEFINVFWRNRILAQLKELPGVYLKETEFDCKQMLVKFGQSIACKLNSFISKPPLSFPAESAEIGGFLLTHKSFNGHPLIISKKPQIFQDLECNLSQLLPWEKDVSSYVEQLSQFLSDDQARENIAGSSCGESAGSKMVCLASFDTLVVLACCLFLNDFDVIIPFSKKRRSQSNGVILQFKDPLYLHGMPQRFHFRRIYKALLDNHHFSCLRKNLKEKYVPPSASNNLGELQEERYRDFTRMLNFEQRTEDRSTKELKNQAREPLITLHDIHNNSDTNSNKPSFIICHESAIMLKTSTNGNETDQNIASSSRQNLETVDDERLVFHVLKLEMQPEFGLELLTIDELVRIALLFTLHPRCKVILVRVGYDGRSIIDVTDLEDLEFKQLCSSRYNLDIQVCLSKLSQLLTKLSKLEIDAEYCLRSTVNTTKCEIFIQSNLSVAPDITLRLSLNMLQFFQSQPTLQCAQMFSWTPVDVNKLTPFHLKSMQIPCTFPRGQAPRRGRSGPNSGEKNPDSGHDNQRGSNSQLLQQPLNKPQNGSTSKKKNKKRNRGKNKQQNTSF